MSAIVLDVYTGVILCYEGGGSRFSRWGLSRHAWRGKIPSFSSLRGLLRTTRFSKIQTKSPAMVRNLTTVSTLVVLLLSLGACVTHTDVSPDEDNAIGESRSPLGETACNTQSCTAANSCSSLAIPTPRRCYYSYASYTTPSSSYGSASCPKQYTIKVTGSTTTRFSPYIEWGDVAQNS